MPGSGDLPFVDEHTRLVDASLDRTWAALDGYVARLTASPHRVLGPVLGTEPSSGFEVLASEPPREVVLGGRHRFATYRLVFLVDPEEKGVRIRALTYADFPGLRGRAYRTGLVLSTGHARATRAMLRTIARRAAG